MTASVWWRFARLQQGLTAAFLAWGSFAGWLNVRELFATVAVFGAAIAFESPAAAVLGGVATIALAFLWMNQLFRAR